MHIIWFRKFSEAAPKLHNVAVLADILGYRYASSTTVTGDRAPQKKYQIQYSDNVCCKVSV